MKDFLNNLKLTWRYARDEKWNLIKYCFAYLGQVVISIIIPILSAKQLIALTDNQLIQLVFISLIIFLVENGRNLLNYSSRLSSQKIFRSTFIKIQTDLGKNVLKLENKELDKNGTGIFIERMTSDSNKLADIFHSVTFWISIIIKDIGIYVAIFIISPLVFCYMLISVFALSYLEHIRSEKKIKKNKEYREQKEKVTGFVGEIVRGSRDIKMLNAEKPFMGELHNKIIKMNQNRFDFVEVDRKYGLLSRFLFDLRDFILIIIFVYLIGVKNFDVALILVMYNYSGIAFGIITHFSSFIDLVKDYNLSAKRVFEIINDSEFAKEKFGKEHLEKAEGNFEFKNVHFSYDKNKVLKGLNFKVNANETVAFVGKSGAGKTTIFNLLCKMYEVDKGTITIDGVNIKKLDKDSIRGNITIISQNPYIFNLSIRDNLRLVKEDLTEEEMTSACKMACLDEFIDNLPEKYDTIIGEGGVNLSGGQKQRLAIARAFVQKTEIILFDEATSALDNETQSKIQEAINNLKKDYTILIIAHRLSTIINSDRILYLNDGKIEAEGTHEELLKNSEGYRHLYESEIME